MPHPLEQKLARLRRRARLYVVLKAASRTVLLIVTVGAVAGAGRWRISFPGSRAAGHFFSGLADRHGCGRPLGRAGSAWQSVSATCRLPSASSSSIRNCAAVWPAPIEFLHEREDDPLAGSAELTAYRDSRRHGRGAIARFAGRARWPPGRRAATSAAVAIAAVALLVMLDVSSARIAAVRLLNPLSNVEWPRVNQLAILEPVLRLPQGQNFELQVVDASGARCPTI